MCQSPKQAQVRCVAVVIPCPMITKSARFQKGGKKFGNGLKINQRLPIKPYSKFILGIAQKTLDE